MTENETFGRFWSVTRFNDIVSVDTNHADFSSEPAITIGDYVPVQQFIAMDPPKHDIQRKVVQPVVALNQNPEQYNKLKDNPALVESMVPEIIRWQTPLMHMRRRATRDISLGDQVIREGDKVVMWYLSGNHDESVIPNADQFIIDRQNPRNHLSFGFGIHRCMGNRLGEMQLRVLWEELLSRFSEIEVVGAPERIQSNFVRGYSALPVVLHR